MTMIVMKSGALLLAAVLTPDAAYVEADNRETPVSPAVAATPAEGAGADTTVPDPLEGFTDNSAGADYFDIMRAKLAAIVRGRGWT